MANNKIQHDISEYTFTNFSRTAIKEEKGKVLEYDFCDFSKTNATDKIKHNKVIKLERSLAKKSGFEISPVVSHFRGLKEQERDELEEKISQEIELRLEKIKAKAYDDGFLKGKEDGCNQIYNEMKLEIDDKLSLVTDLISETLSYKSELLKEEKKKLYHLVRNLSKWVILKELDEDDDYLNRLLEKLVGELDTKSNLLIQVNKSFFEKIPDVLDIVQNKIGEMEKIRLEIDFDINGPGIMLSSENSLIDGTLLEQFNSLDKLFRPVGLDVSPDNLNVLERLNKVPSLVKKNNKRDRSDEE